jgi:hypothetical protein
LSSGGPAHANCDGAVTALLQSGIVSHKNPPQNLGREFVIGSGAPGRRNACNE